MGDVLDGRDSAAPSHEEGEALGVERMVRQPVQALLLHLPAALALDAPDLQLQVDPRVPTRQVADAAPPAIVARTMAAPTRATACFFPRRRRRMTRALGSPNIPWTVRLGRKPGKRYVSHRRRCVRIPESCQILRPPDVAESPLYIPIRATFRSPVYPLGKEKSPNRGEAEMRWFLRKSMRIGPCA